MIRRAIARALVAWLFFIEAAVIAHQATPPSTVSFTPGDAE